MIPDAPRKHRPVRTFATGSGDFVRETSPVPEQQGRPPAAAAPATPPARKLAVSEAKRFADEHLQSTAKRQKFLEAASSTQSPDSGALEPTFARLPPTLVMRVFRHIPSLDLWRSVRPVSRNMQALVLRALDRRHQFDAWRVFFTGEREDVARLTAEVFTVGHRPSVDLRWRGYDESRGAFRFVAADHSARNQVPPDPFGDVDGLRINADCTMDESNYQRVAVPFPSQGLGDRASTSGNMVMTWSGWAKPLESARGDVPLLHPIHSVALPVSFDMDAEMARTESSDRFNVGQGCIVGWRSLILRGGHGQEGEDADPQQGSEHSLTGREMSIAAANSAIPEMPTPADSEADAGSRATSADAEAEAEAERAGAECAASAVPGEDNVEFVRLTRSMKRSIARSYMLTPPRSAKKPRAQSGARANEDISRVLDGGNAHAVANLESRFSLLLQRDAPAAQDALWVHPHVVYVHASLLFGRTAYRPQTAYPCPSSLRAGSIPLLQTVTPNDQDTSGWFSGAYAQLADRQSRVRVPRSSPEPTSAPGSARQPAGCNPDWVLGATWTRLTEALKEINAGRVNKIPQSFIDPTNAPVMRFLVNNDGSRAGDFLRGTILPLFEQSRAAWWNRRVLDLREREQQRRRQQPPLAELHLHKRKEPVRWWGV